MSESPIDSPPERPTIARGPRGGLDRQTTTLRFKMMPGPAQHELCVCGVRSEPEARHGTGRSTLFLQAGTLNPHQSTPNYDSSVHESPIMKDPTAMMHAAYTGPGRRPSAIQANSRTPP
jgi:hypothetical protein